MTAEIRPGVHRPDWSVLATAGARKAIFGRARARFGLIEKWNQPLEPAQDHVWRTVLELFARWGRPPGLREISKEAGLSEEQTRTLVSDAQPHALPHSEASSDVILYPAPYAGERSERNVQLCGQRLHAG